MILAYYAYMQQQNTEVRKRTRSPAYPFIGLREALERAKTLWERATRHYVPDPVAIQYWGYDANSSSGYSTIAALKKFGLVDEEGSGAKRQIKLSDLGISLVYNPDNNSAEYRENLKKAALMPSMHSELWTKYGGELPDDAVIERYLVVDRKFNSTYVNGFIDQFRNTAEFAKLSSHDKMESNQSMTPSLGPPSASPLRPAPKQLRLDLDSGPVVINYPMSRGDFELLTSTLSLWERKLVSSGEGATPPEQSLST
jgi:hypothetical protein